MDIDLRKAIIAKNAGASTEDLESTIRDAIASGQEKMLPGLGVFFEICWNQATDDERQVMVENLAQGIPKQ